jgi:hypothetical protein
MIDVFGGDEKASFEKIAIVEKSEELLTQRTVTQTGHVRIKWNRQRTIAVSVDQTHASLIE